MLYLPPEPTQGQPVKARDIAAIIRYLKAITPRTSAGNMVQSGAGGSTHHPLQPVRRNTTPAGTAATPFQVTWQAVSSAPGTYQARVEHNSSMLRSLSALSNRQTITGLTTYDAAGNVDPSSWFNFDYGNDLIYLEITISGTTGLATAATINSWGLGGSWGPDDNPGQDGSGTGFFEYDQDTDAVGNSYYWQTLARFPLFSSVTSPSGAFAITNTQMASTNLLMLPFPPYNGPTQADGNFVCPLSMPIPWAGPFVQTS